MRLTRYFFNGLIVLVPAVATTYMVYVFFVKIDGLFRFKLPGLGFAVTVLTITLIGFAASNILANKAVQAVDRLFRRLPLLRMIYTAVKDLTGAFVGDRRGFTKPVSVLLIPGSDVSALGFVTGRDLKNLGMPGYVSVYLPQSYNFAGNLIVVPAERVTPIEAEGSAVMAFIVSGGISSEAGR